MQTSLTFRYTKEPPNTQARCRSLTRSSVAVLDHRQHTTHSTLYLGTFCPQAYYQRIVLCLHQHPFNIFILNAGLCFLPHTQNIHALFLLLKMHIVSSNSISWHTKWPVLLSSIWGGKTVSILTARNKMEHQWTTQLAQHCSLLAEHGYESNCEHPC